MAETRKRWRCVICGDTRDSFAPADMTAEEAWWDHYRANHAQVPA